MVCIKNTTYDVGKPQGSQCTAKVTVNTEYTFQVATADMNRSDPFSDSIRLRVFGISIYAFSIVYVFLYCVCITDQSLLLSDDLFSKHRSPLVCGDHCSELHHCKCLLE